MEAESNCGTDAEVNGLIALELPFNGRFCRFVQPKLDHFEVNGHGTSVLSSRDEWTGHICIRDALLLFRLTSVLSIWTAVESSIIVSHCFLTPSHRHTLLEYRLVNRRPLSLTITDLDLVADHGCPRKCSTRFGAHHCHHTGPLRVFHQAGPEGSRRLPEAQGQLLPMAGDSTWHGRKSDSQARSWRLYVVCRRVYAKGHRRAFPSGQRLDEPHLPLRRPLRQRPSQEGSGAYHQDGRAPLY